MAIDNLKVEFACEMTCSSCKSKIETALASLSGVHLMEISVTEQKLLLKLSKDCKHSVSDIQKAIESQANIRCVIKGFGAEEAIVVELHGPKNVIGVIRITQLVNICVFDGVIDSISGSGKNVSMNIHEYGDLSGSGFENIGEVYANICDELGDGSECLASLKVEVVDFYASNCIGRSLAITNKTSKKILAAGIIARASTIGNNDKGICACSGKTIWQERNDQKFNSTNWKSLNYNEDDFIKVATGIDSEFDRLLKKTWDEAKQFDVFRYNVDEGSILSRIIPGKFGFVAQFNKQRGSLRRKPQSSSALKMPFQPDLFNFTNAKPEEVLFTLKIDGASTETSILINNSPIEYCSSLMVPDLRSCLPQVFTTDALFQAICLIALSAQKSLRMGFNSLGAAASVNHLHMHLYYFDFDLEIENFETSGDSFLEDWPIKGIMFVIEELNIKKFKEVADCVSRLVEKCYQMNIAHNLFLTRNRCGNAIKVILWPRKPEFGSKNDMDLAAAMCEFSGFFICKTEECYTTLSEEMCIDLIKSVDVVSGNVKVEFSQILDSQSFGN